MESFCQNCCRAQLLLKQRRMLRMRKSCECWKVCSDLWSVEETCGFLHSPINIGLTVARRKQSGKGQCLFASGCPKFRFLCLLSVLLHDGEANEETNTRKSNHEQKCRQSYRPFACRKIVVYGAVRVKEGLKNGRVTVNYI